MKEFKNTVIGGMIVAMVTYCFLLFLFFSMLFHGVVNIFRNIHTAGAFAITNNATSTSATGGRGNGSNNGSNRASNNGRVIIEIPQVPVPGQASQPTPTAEN